MYYLQLISVHNYFRAGRGQPAASPASTTQVSEPPQQTSSTQRSPPRSGPAPGLDSQQNQLEGRFARMAVDERHEPVTRMGKDGQE